jgi:purine-nucleoside phosphorylase
LRNLAAQISELVTAVRVHWDRVPAAGIVLGSGLGELACEIEVEATLAYEELPHFGKTTALGHAGQLVCGSLEDRPVIAFRGRFHLYEGKRAQEAGMPVRLLQAMGGRLLVVSNAAGGLNPHYSVGDVMVIDDHINLLFDNPLIGINDDELGPRFPDMSQPYDTHLQHAAARCAREAGFHVHRGVYVAMLGPTYETRAEYRMCRLLGGDAVGMSTVPEVLVARHAGIRVLGLSTITNVGSPDAPAATSGHEVLAAAQSAAGKLTTIVRSIVRQEKPA